MYKNKYSIAVIAGDGIGKEVMPEGIRCLEAISSKHGINLEFKEYNFSSVEYYQKHGSRSQMFTAILEMRHNVTYR